MTLANHESALGFGLLFSSLANVGLDYIISDVSF